MLAYRNNSDLCFILFSMSMTTNIKSCVFTLVLLFTVHLLHAEDLTTTSMNTTKAYSSSSGNVTCGENQEYCEDTQSCSRENRQCNGCTRSQVLCPDGRCVNLVFTRFKVVHPVLLENTSVQMAGATRMTTT